MANECCYSMLIKGTKENCYKWLAKMKSYEETDHFYRIFESQIEDESGTDDAYTMRLFGYCAWSLNSCCQDGYCNLFAKNTKNLDLKMEAFSEEPGFCFQEHYIYDRGKCLKDECVKWNEIFWDEEEYPKFEDFIKATGIEDLNLSENEFDDYGYYHVGGFDNYGDFTI